MSDLAYAGMSSLAATAFGALGVWDWRMPPDPNGSIRVAFSRAPTPSQPSGVQRLGRKVRAVCAFVVATGFAIRAILSLVA